MPKALNLTNQKFGHLTAIERVENKGRKTYWKCKCDCGREKEVQTGHLTSGTVITCGDKNCEFHYNPSAKNEENICILCGNKFISNNYQRKYCYSCSPAGVGPKIALRYKTRAVKHALILYKGGKCEICGYSKCEGALQFHHNDPQQKDFGISHINLNGDSISMQDLYTEVDKCSLLCANCHFEQHYLDDINIEN